MCVRCAERTATGGNGVTAAEGVTAAKAAADADAAADRGAGNEEDELARNETDCENDSGLVCESENRRARRRPTTRLIVTENPGGRDWVLKAMCLHVDPEQLFVSGAEQNKAKDICKFCPVKRECLADALDFGCEFGIWGGLTERERRLLRRRRPDIRSWRAALAGEPGSGAPVHIPES
jgi:WhiB family transcriptional regulator, redox-sensing transcriptional regulator